uniref:Uncharacterized protein n=1 Tax=Zea mays TaxID=4577 RepID=C4J1W1_MAIZE|nr:unknown [Zea mays]|eukprot:NP_001182932.1 uncharacterized protein LOC100501222 [Zea mays]
MSVPALSPAGTMSPDDRMQNSKSSAESEARHSQIPCSSPSCPSLAAPTSPRALAVPREDTEVQCQCFPQVHLGFSVPARLGRIQHSSAPPKHCHYDVYACVRTGDPKVLHR